MEKIEKTIEKNVNFLLMNLPKTLPDFKTDHMQP